MTDLLETVYEHERSRGTFTVTAAEPWSISMIRRLKAKYPDQVSILHTNPDGSMVVHLPFEWMRIVPKRKDTLSDEERAIRSERMKELKRNAGIEKTAPNLKDSGGGGASACPESSNVKNAAPPSDTRKSGAGDQISTTGNPAHEYITAPSGRQVLPSSFSADREGT